MKLKKMVIVATVLAGLIAIPLASAYAADGAPASSALTDANGNAVNGNAAAAAPQGGGGFMEVVFG